MGHELRLELDVTRENGPKKRISIKINACEDRIRRRRYLEKSNVYQRSFRVD